MGPEEIIRQPVDDVDWKMLGNILEEGDVIGVIERTVSERIERAEEVINDVADFASDIGDSVSDFFSDLFS